MASKERAVQKAILDYLALKKILAFRMNTGAFPLSYKGKSRFVRFGRPGMADVLAFTVGYAAADKFGYGWETVEGIIIPSVFWIEVKSPTGKQSEDQKIFQQEVEAVGCRYILARSLDDVMKVL